MAAKLASSEGGGGGQGPACTTDGEGWGGFAPDRLPDRAVKGRGAVGNPGIRFESTHTEAVDDGWRDLLLEEEPPPLATTLTRDASRSIISYNTSPDIGFDRAINPYRGCEHGCVYCYARPTHAYLGLSPGLDFETKLLFKPEAAELLERELRKPGYVPRPIALGSNTDPYQPVEKQLRLTRAILEVLARFNHPCTIVTKSALVLRDAELLADMARRKLVRVMLSVTTLDRTLARLMEPRAASPARRLQAVAGLAQAGVPVGVMTAPVIPGLNDCEIEPLLEQSARAGASAAGYVLLRLPHEIRDLFTDWLNTHYPERAKKVLALVRETRGGALNEPRFHHRHTGQGPFADLIARRFAIAARRFGLDAPQAGLDCTGFAAPRDARAEAAERQLSLL
ncbi:MAG: PA0069 family radical SAM protein [Alphaproteobacteria bacterium]|nr:PA0069 family radical SAM protein [Alphaproteobacteria bacterium]